MHPQHLAAQPQSATATAALESHFRRLGSSPYAMAMNCSKVTARNTDVSLTSNPGSSWHEAVSDPLNSDRRLRCQRASNYWPHSALSQPFQLAPQSSRKNTSWLHPSPSRLSPYTQVSTSNTFRGQARAPASTSPHMGLFVRGASC